MTSEGADESSPKPAKPDENECVSLIESANRELVSNRERPEQQETKHARSGPKQASEAENRAPCDHLRNRPSSPIMLSFRSFATADGLMSMANMYLPKRDKTVERLS